MESVDMKKLETAIIYLQRISEGNNPINNLPVEEDSVINNPNVIRCMFFIKDVLEEVRKNNGYIGKKPAKRGKTDFPLEILEIFHYKGDKPISKFVEQINEPLDTDIYKKLGYTVIMKWLKYHGFLKEEYNEKRGKTIKVPTEKGRRLGIRTEEKMSSAGNEYLVVLYNRNAQEYLIQNMEAILTEEFED